ncbi:hypothetical protein [Oceanobacillus sp. CAU 1775]
MGTFDGTNWTSMVITYNGEGIIGNVAAPVIFQDALYASWIENGQTKVGRLATPTETETLRMHRLIK